LTLGDYKDTYIVHSEKYFNILSCLRVAHEWDGQTDEQVAVGINSAL